MRLPFYEVLREAYDQKHMVSIFIDPDDTSTHEVGIIWGLSEALFSFQSISDDAEFGELKIVEIRRVYELKVFSLYHSELQERLSGAFVECPPFSGLDIPGSLRKALEVLRGLGELVRLEFKNSGAGNGVSYESGRLLSVSEKIYTLEHYTDNGVSDGISYGLIEDIFCIVIKPAKLA